SDGDAVQPAQPAVAITALARSMARQAGLEVFSLQGSGPEGRVVLADVVKALERGKRGARKAGRGKRDGSAIGDMGKQKSRLT
ncbi:MAG: E3 binding domain-containing protein, partial [Isosphaeraceae bacterium]